LVVATEVHHVIKLVVAPERRLDPTNVVSLCHDCHGVRTGRGE
jgi:5-methylcytosine-specific restriction endonuclease McrA